MGRRHPLPKTGAPGAGGLTTSVPVMFAARPSTHRQADPMALNVLYIGGTGQISLPCVEQSVAAGHTVTVFNRGQTGAGLPKGVETIAGDMNGPDGYAALGSRSFDVICQFMAFTPEQMARDITAFTGRTGQYIVISSASVYEKPARHYVIT